MPTFFHREVVHLTESAPIHADGSEGLLLVVHTKLKMDKNIAGYDEAKAADLTAETVEFLKVNTRYDGAIFQTV